jgi:hypothetical protein
VKRLHVLLCCTVAASCGSVEDPAEQDPPDAGVAEPDAAPAELCNGLDDDGDGKIDEDWQHTYVEGFDNTRLPLGWDEKVGPSPTFNLVGSELLITNAGVADTPSMANGSWIYDIEKDRGNQLARKMEIGEADFDLVADMHWVSTSPQFSLAGIAVTDEEHWISFFIGLYDPSNHDQGTSGKILVRTPDGQPNLDKLFLPSESLTIHVEARRRLLELEVVVTSGSERVTWKQPMKEKVERLAIVALKGRADPFGIYGLSYLAMCGAPIAP